MRQRTELLCLLTAVAIGAAQPALAATTTTAVTSTSWVYYNGSFDWPTDYSFAASLDYRDKTGEPRSGAYDIKVQVTGAWGGWSPVANNFVFNDKAYNHLTLSLKPTVANQTWKIYFVGAGGQPLANECTRSVNAYGAAPVLGQWKTYTIPLSDLCVAGDAAVYKFAVQDTTGLSDNTWFVDNVGFEALGSVPVGPPQPVPPPPVPTPPPVASGTSWVYYKGTLDWPGDYSFSVNVDYNDKSGQPLSGAHDTKVSLTGPWGGWLPYALNWNFKTDGYTKLTFALKPTQESQQWSLYFIAVGDHPLPNPCTVNVLDYGPAPVVGRWATYTVPLSKLCVANTSIYKFAIQDKTGSSDNVWYVDNAGFAP
jgi:hypothetical protein